MRWQDLPQAAHIKSEDAERWIAKIRQVDPEREEWHLKRLNGIGGSEIGTIISGSDFFSSANLIAKGKLMRVLPQDDNGDLRRGRAMEDIVRDIFRKKYSAEPLDSVMKEAGNVRLHGWLVGNPDDVVRIGGKVYLVDYKATVDSDSSDVHFGYVCQLHHYNHIVKAITGKGADGFLLVKHSYKEWDAKALVVPFDPKLSDKILEAGTDFWENYVLQGKEPPLPSFGGEDVEEPVEVAEERREMERRLMAVLACKKELAELEKEAKEALVGFFSEHGGKTEILSSQMRRGKDYEAAMKQIVLACGKNLADYQIPGSSWDADAMGRALIDKGEPDLQKYRIPEMDEEKVKALAEEYGLDGDLLAAKGQSFSLPRGTVESVEELRGEFRRVLDEFLPAAENADGEELSLSSGF